jgi:hypothetical protein
VPGPPPVQLQVPAQAPPPEPVPTAAIEVIPYDIGRYLPHTAESAAIIVSVTPPTGTVSVYTPGLENAPVAFKGPKASGEVRLNGPMIYLHLEDGATGYEVQILSWREP